MRFTEKRMIALVFLVVLTISIPTYIWWSIYSWGADGELTLETSVDSAVLQSDRTLNLTVTLTNTGKTRLRVLPFGSGSLSVAIYNSSGNYVRYKLPVPTSPPPKDSDLVTINPGERIATVIRVNNESWDLAARDNYTIRVAYYVHDLNEVTLPHWEGTIWANPVVFQRI